MYKRLLKTALLLLLIFTVVGTTPTFAQKAAEPTQPTIDDGADPTTPPDQGDSNIEGPTPTPAPGSNEIVEDAEDTSGEGKILDPFQVRLTAGVQSAWTGRIPLTIEITPRINAQRTEVSWDAGFGVSIVDRFEDFFAIPQGQTVVKKAYIVPSSPGSYTVTVNVTDWGYGRNYSSSDSLIIALDDSLTVTPRPAAYSGAVLIKYIVIGVVSIGLLVAAVFLSKKFIRWMKVWLKPPEL